MRQRWQRLMDARPSVSAVGQRARAAAPALQQVKGHALRGLRTDARQRAQRVDESGERSGVLHLTKRFSRRAS